MAAFEPLHHHFRPKSGWINDPNGLVYYKGYYHVFYQHAPHFETPWHEAMHWGHARTKDFLAWEELPVALCPDEPYDKDGCWSGTAIVRDDVLYLFYASIKKPATENQSEQSVSVAYSTDGIHFTTCGGNPVIPHFPADGGHDFRDPAVCCIDGKYYCVMASGHPETKTARLLLYSSDDLFHWQYEGIAAEWADCKYAECPSLLPADEGHLLTVSVCPLQERHYFSVMYGQFDGHTFRPHTVGDVDKGPDQYAGQVFRDHLGRNLLISWIPGWKYAGYTDHDIGCMSVPRELTLRDGVIRAFPIKEVQHLLTDSDPAVIRTADGFRIEREGRAPVVWKGQLKDLKILRDSYVLEVFVNGGKEVYTALL